MNIHKRDVFIADVERQFEWYVQNASWDLAERYLSAVEATCNLLAQHPLIGAHVRFRNPKLQEWRFFVIFRPFEKHVLFYEVRENEVIMRRMMHGSRDLPRRLLESH